MVLVLVVHTLEAVSATVPISMISLREAIDRRALPDELRIRQVLPTSGLRCTSLWDVTDKDVLLQWMNENLGPDVSHEILEVVEEFTFGVTGDLARHRTAEKLAATGRKTAGTISQKTKATLQAAGHKIEELDTKWKVSENTNAAFQSAKQTGAAVLGRISGSVGQTKAKGSPRVAQTASAVGTGLTTGWKKIGTGLGVARDQVSKLFTGSELKRSASTGDDPSTPTPEGALQGNDAESTHSAPDQTPGQQTVSDGPAQPGGTEQAANGAKDPPAHVATDAGAVFSLGDEGDDAVATPPKKAP